MIILFKFGNYMEGGSSYCIDNILGVKFKGNLWNGRILI